MPDVAIGEARAQLFGFVRAGVDDRGRGALLGRVKMICCTV